MKAVLKRECRSLLLSVRGIVFLGVYLFAAGIFAVLYNINAATASFEIALSYLMPVLVLTLPLLSADAFVDDKQQGTARVLRILPLQMRDIILGKYLARLCVLGIPTAVLLLYPLILDLYGTVQYATAYLSLLALFLVGAILLALGMWISAKASTRRYATVWSYCAFAIWYASGIVVGLMPRTAIASLIAFMILGALVGVAIFLWTKRWTVALAVALVAEIVPALLFFVARARLEGAFEAFVTFLSPFRAFDDFVFGVLDFGTLFSYGLWIAFFLLLTVIAYGKENGMTPSLLVHNSLWQKASAAMLSLGIIGGMALVLIGTAFVPSRVTRADATKEKFYTVSAQTKNLISSLEDEVTVYVLDADRTDHRFEIFLDTMAGYSRNLTVSYVDTASDPQFLVEHDLTGSTVTPYSLVVAGEDREQFIAYENLFSFSNETLGFSGISISAYQYYLYTFQSNSQYSDYLSALLYDTVRDFEGETLISLLIEYAAAKEIPTVYFLEGYGTKASESMAAYVMAYYGVEYRSFSFSAIPIVPTDASSLILAKPQKDISAAELEALRTYLKNGGQLTVLTDESNLSMPNLCALLADYQLAASEGALVELVEAEEEGGEATEEATLTATPNFQHDMLADYADESSFSIAVTGANAISYPPKPSGSLLITPLLTTSETTYPKGSPDDQGSRTVAVAAETADGARVVWFTGADSFLGDLSGTPTNADVNNALCVLLAAQWSTKQYQSSLEAVAAKPYSVEPMAISSGASSAWSVILIVLIPAAAVAVGSVKRYQRKKAK